MSLKCFVIYTCLLSQSFALTIENFNVNVYEKPNQNLINWFNNDKVLLFGINAVLDDYRTHMWSVRNNKNPTYLAECSGKYKESVYGIIPNEIVKALFGINEYSDNNTDIIKVEKLHK